MKKCKRCKGTGVISTYDNFEGVKWASIPPKNNISGQQCTKCYGKGVKK